MCLRSNLTANVCQVNSRPGAQGVDPQRVEGVQDAYDGVGSAGHRKIVKRITNVPRKCAVEKKATDLRTGQVDPAAFQ